MSSNVIFNILHIDKIIDIQGKTRNKIHNIVAALRGMHVSPVKHSYVWLPRKCYYRTDTWTDGQTDARQSASQATQKSNFVRLTTNIENCNMMISTMNLLVWYSSLRSLFPGWAIFTSSSSSSSQFACSPTLWYDLKSPAHFRLWSRLHAPYTHTSSFSVELPSSGLFERLELASDKRLSVSFGNGTMSSMFPPENKGIKYAFKSSSVLTAKIKFLCINFHLTRQWPVQARAVENEGKELPHRQKYKNNILYTALNSPSLIFALWRSETYSTILEFAHTPVFLYNPLYTIQLAQF